MTLLVLIISWLVSIISADSVMFKQYNAAEPYNGHEQTCAFSCLQDPTCKGFSVDISNVCTFYDDLDCSGELVITENIWIKRCSEEFKGGIFGNQLYLVKDGAYNYSEAKEFCESRDGYLAELVDPEEREAVWSYTKTKVSSQSRLWVGIVQRNATDTGQYRDYKWERSNVDIPSTNEYWRNRVLQTDSTRPACGGINADSMYSTFHDGECSRYYSLVCELDN